MMPIILTQETAEVSPVFLIVFVAAIIGLTFWVMKKTSDSATIVIKKRYEGKILGEFTFNISTAFITEDEFVIQQGAGSFIAYPLANIGYVRAYRDGVDRSWYFVVYDKDKKYKGLDAKLISGPKNTRPYKSAPRTMMKPDEANRLCEFVMAHAPHIQMWQK